MELCTNAMGLQRGGTASTHEKGLSRGDILVGSINLDFTDSMNPTVKHLAKGHLVLW